MKRNLFLGVCLAAFIAPTGVKAQYPQLTSEASQTYAKMKEELYRRSDEAWAKALPVVQKEAREGRPYIPWASRPYDLPQAKIPAFPGAEGGGMFTFGGRGGKVITVAPDLSVRLAKPVGRVPLCSMCRASSSWNLPSLSALLM